MYGCDWSGHPTYFALLYTFQSAPYRSGCLRNVRRHDLLELLNGGIERRGIARDRCPRRSAGLLRRSRSNIPRRAPRWLSSSRRASPRTGCTGSATLAPVDRGLPRGRGSGDIGVPVRVPLRRLGGHIHAQRLELLRDERRILPVVGERNRVVDRELDDLAALGPAVCNVACRRSSRPTCRCRSRCCSWSCAGAFHPPRCEDVVDVVTGRQLVCLGRGGIRNIPGGREIVGETAVGGEERLLGGQDQSARGGRGHLVARLAQQRECVAVDRRSSPPCARPRR